MATASRSAPATTSSFHTYIGKRFAIAGTFKGPSGVIPALIQARGGELIDSLDPSLDYFVVGASGAATARKKVEGFNKKGAGIIILDQDAFLEQMQPTREELITLVTSPDEAEVWKAIFASYIMPLPSLAGADLRKLCISGTVEDVLRLDRLTLDGCDLRGVRLTNVVLPPMTEANLEGAELIGCSIIPRGQAFARNNLRRAKLVNVKINWGDLSGTDFSGADLTGATWEKCNGNGVLLREARLHGAYFTDCRLVAAVLEKADLTGADLTSVRLTQANLRGATLRGALLTSTNLGDADLSDADLRDADLAGVNLIGAKLSGADLTGAFLAETHVKLTQLQEARGVDFEQFECQQQPQGKVKELADALQGGGLSVFKVSLWHGMLETKFSIRANRATPTTFTAHYWGVNLDGSERPARAIQSASLSAILLSLGRRLSDYTVDPDSLELKTYQASLPEDELRALGLSALYEAFGQTPLESDTSSRKALAREQEQKYVALLRGGEEGVAAWNKLHEWVRQGIKSLRGIDLSGQILNKAQLSSMDVRKANFSKAQLAQAELIQADCRKTTFAGAMLDGFFGSGAKFLEADFSGASLREAYLEGSNFKDASFRGADLREANLKQTNLRGADLTEANLEGTQFDDKTSYDEATRWPKGFDGFRQLKWAGQGPNPALALVPKSDKADVESVIQRLGNDIDASRLANAMKMLKADRFQLFADVSGEGLIGVVKSQSDPTLAYACRLTSEGAFSCCTQNLNICGGLRGKLCKHMMVLLIGLAKGGEVDPNVIDDWIHRSLYQKPVLDKNLMGEIFLRYKGAEAGEIDWRPTETVPEDYYVM